MTNNYFLHTKSLEVRSFEDYKTGMSKLIEIKYKCTPDEYIYRHDNVYYQAHYTSLCGAENSEAITAIMQYIEQCKPYKVDITSDTVFEHEFPSYNVGFMGIDFSSIEDIKKEKVYQVLMGARVEEYQEILKGVQGAEITAWWDRAVDIIPVNAGKGAGIEKMLKHYGIDRSQAMAFGDGNNDIEMLKAVGNGIAMANASDDLKAVADEICGDVSEDGIYHYCLEKRMI